MQLTRFILASLCLLLLHCTTVRAQLPAGGENLVKPFSANQPVYRKDGLGEARVEENAEGISQLRLITQVRPGNIYELSRSFPLQPKALPAGRAILVSFEAKTEKSSLETGEAKLLVQVKQSESYKNNLSRTMSIANEWRTYYIPFETDMAVAKGNLKLVLQFGYPPQELLLRNLQFNVYPAEIDIDDLPVTHITYAGRAVGAGWRAEAARRIELNRKGAISLQLLDESGVPIPEIPVEIKLKRHAFGWGAAVNAQAIRQEPKRLKYIAQAFNEVVLENDLKIKRWSQPELARQTVEVLDQLAEHGIGVKGHVLIWPGFQYLPEKVSALRNQPEQVARLMDQHLASVLDKTAGKISHWDVVNEAYSNRDLQEITGSEEILYAGFRQLAARDATVGRFTNEFGIISRGGHDEVKQKWYYDYIRRIDENTGGLVDGIGIQCHMGSDLTAPERVLELLDYYGTLGKKISISEFTIDLDDPELRFDYTRDILTVAFSHPAVSEFLFWGYHAKSHPKASIYNEDWSIGDMGQAFFSLVHGLWQTEISATTDLGGRIQGRGFYGDYAYRYTLNGEVKTGTFRLEPGAAALLTLRPEE